MEYSLNPEHYYLELAIAYIRGKYPELSALDDQQLLEAAMEKGLQLHRFKRTAGLPRVRKVIGVLKSFAPRTLLDIGTGRGVFLWPLLDEMTGIEVTAVDLLGHRVDDINAVREGGFERVLAVQHNAEDLPWPQDSFDAVTILEVLEHVENPELVAQQVLRVAGKAVIASVPAKEDDNPEHIRFFTRNSLAARFRDAGAESVQIEYVLNHMIAVGKP